MPNHFRPDIEGLRAVAILAVLAFHAHVPFLSGGFVGVDVFFVISGFLITGLLLREQTTSGRIDLVTFYARRARRLLPAALTVIAVTLVASALLLSSVRFPDAAGDGAAAALYVSNYRFALTATDYFAEAAAPSPFLHFWSLGVEEQFYLLWPLLLMGAMRLVSVRRLWIPVAIIALASFALSVVVTGIQPPWAFYSLPTRAWQIALGALIAMAYATTRPRLPRSVASLLGVGGLLMIIAAVIMIDDSVAYPGWWAGLPAAGAALLIVSGEHHGRPMTRLLGGVVPRWFGRVSYSLYLWHWPILVLGPEALGRDGLSTRLALAALAIGIAAMSTRWIEAPFRAHWGSGPGSPRRTLAISGAMSGTLAVIVLVSSGVGASPPVRSTDLPDLIEPSSTLPEGLRPVLAGPIPAGIKASLPEARGDRGRLVTGECQPGTTESTLRHCTYGDTTASTTVVLFGDSHAGMWLPAVERIAIQRQWRVVPMVKPGCTPVRVTVWDNELKRPFHECDEWRDRVVQWIAEQRPKITFVVTSRSYAVAGADGEPLAEGRLEAWKAGLVDVLGDVRAASEEVVLIGETPHLDMDPLECLATQERVEACRMPRSEAVNAVYMELEESAAREAGVVFARTIDWVCPGDPCPLILGDYLVYRNPGHLTATITAALAPRLLWELDRALETD